MAFLDFAIEGIG